MTRKEKDTEVMRVIFRKFNKRNGGDILALFPAEAGDMEPHRTCLCYVHLGQHSTAAVALMWNGSTVPARPAEYAELQRELEHIGYVLKIAHRFTRADLESRIQQCKGES